MAHLVSLIICKIVHQCSSFVFTWIVDEMWIIDSLNLFNSAQSGPPLWSSGQSSWLQIQTSGFDSYQIFWEVVCLERGPLSLVSTTEELLGRKRRA
jgi:hypothetical protein